MNIKHLDQYKTSMINLDQYPIRFIENNQIIKLKQEDQILTIGVTDKSNENVLELLKSYHKGLKIILTEIASSELTSFISKTRNISDTDIDIEIQETDLTRLANDAPIINLVNSIIIDGINMNASDIHIEAYQKVVLLRYRVDGVLFEADNINIKLFSTISSRIKIMANLNIMEKRQPQDGRISVVLEGVNIDLRVSIVPLSEGESIVLRLFIKKDRIITLKELGYSGRNLSLLKSVIELPHGLILITGPTGSGKTTTLNALLQLLNSSDKKIITIEDPVEYTVSGINQIPVNSDIDLGFSDILRRVLRQDPDIIMIGEIRDKETAELVIRASLTGHLVLSTLHTNDAVSSIPRLKDLGIPEYLITSVLKASFAQRLIRTKCQNCLGSGCNLCFDRGFKGRTVISEGFIMNDKLESLILDEVKPYQLKKHLKQEGMLSLYDEGIKKLKDGLTTKEELERVLPIGV